MRIPRLHVRLDEMDQTEFEFVRVNIEPEAYLDDIDIFEDKKEYVQWLFRMKKMIRDSREYKVLVKHLKYSRGMNHCGIHPNQIAEEGFRIELHHTPFVLEDIVDIVVRKRLMKSQSMKMQDIAYEVVQLHWLGLVGLYPLCMICHALIHDPKLDPIFIPMKNVYGDPKTFAEMYWDYFSDSMKTKWQNLVTLENSYTIIENNLPPELQKKYIYIQPYEDKEVSVIGTDRLIDFTKYLNTPIEERDEDPVYHDKDGFIILRKKIS